MSYSRLLIQPLKTVFTKDQNHVDMIKSTMQAHSLSSLLWILQTRVCCNWPLISVTLNSALPMPEQTEAWHCLIPLYSESRSGFLYTIPAHPISHRKNINTHITMTSYLLFGWLNDETDVIHVSFILFSFFRELVLLLVFRQTWWCYI